ncbi:MAG: hypothetical protein AMK70_09180 [Nitrospira bacterium SG8_35_1]|nr:MAG: hypothetical protein AMK70_09180 [Nitrospira bacterium SG8_35_1]
MKPLASISLDLDNKWSYLKTRGDRAWESYPSYFDRFIPYVTDILDRNDLKITFFIVGKDASIQSNHEYLKLLTEKGHEVGNHAFSHDPAIESSEKQDIKNEILVAEEHIFSATNQRPVGFRSPGFSWSKSLLEVLSECNYKYDASLFPTYIAPLARFYFFLNADLSRDEKKKLRRLYGSFFEGFRSSKPYCWKIESGKKLYEVPVTTFPIIKTPIHFTYLLYLSKSEKLMYSYLKGALALCSRFGTGLSFLLHPTDLLDLEQVPEMSYFPGMDIHRSRKLEIFNNVVKMISEKFKPVTMGTHIEAIENEKEIKTVNLF